MAGLQNFENFLKRIPLLQSFHNNVSGLQAMTLFKKDSSTGF